ncbi:MAG: glycoside hydrolase family 3 protein [Chlamydiae bacterium]|nr:glycoside hydrolase family 3 protein [Chlamydiota bacterium]
MKKAISLLFTFFVSFSKIHALNSTDLSLEEKIGQLFLVHFHGDVANDDAKQLITDCHVGGFVFYNWSNSLSSPEQVRCLTESLFNLNSKHSRVPLFTAVDQEGGRVQRLKNGVLQLPSAQFLGDLDIPDLIYQLARIQAEELKSLGININFAPVVDVNSNPKNPVIGDRAYSNDPDKVTEYAKAFMKAYDEVGVLPVIKHFPGHGDTKKDSHISSPKLKKTYKELKELELKTFYNLKNEARAIMTAHIKLPLIDSEKVSSTSPLIIENILRQSWGYDNLVISDSLIMRGIISSEGSIENAAVSAINAGTDILCLAGAALNEESQDELSVMPIISLHKYLVNAVKTGMISEEHLNKSVNRILREKERIAPTLSSIPKEVEDTKQILSRELILLKKINSFENEVYEKIGQAIWKNETGMSREKLLYWNPKEDFLSLGIGHFIWHPKKKKADFEETFPSLVKFAKKNKIETPKWLDYTKNCPWESRDQYINDAKSTKVLDLQKWLEENMSIQGKFLIQRLLSTIHLYLHSSSVTDKIKILTAIESLSNTPEGLYALVDYLNFKGSGLSEKERYKNQGWGLLQVLNLIDSEKNTIPIEEFVHAAQQTLETRVNNSNDPEKEKIWLKGWVNRVHRYRSL